MRLREALRQIDWPATQLGAAGRPSAHASILPLPRSSLWLEGRTDEAVALWREALAHEEAIDVLGQASEMRVRLARACLRRGEASEAARCSQPVLARAAEDGGPGGALFAPDALRELATPRATARARTRITPACGHGARSSWQKPRFRRRGASRVRPNRAPMPLTGRELEVLARIAAGDSNKHIARALDLSLHTVKRHVANILGKLELTTRGQAADWYRRR